MNQSDNSNNNQNNFQIFRPIPTKISSINKIIQFTMDKSEDNNNSSVNKDIFDGKMRSSCFEKSLQLSVNKKQTYVTNIINNYYILKKNFVGKKRGRKPAFSKLKPKRIKKKDKTKVKIHLNQICINHLSLSHFPIVKMDEDELTVELFVRLLNEEFFFEIIDNCSTKKDEIIEEDKINLNKYIETFNKEKGKNHLYLKDENETETNPLNLIKNFYKQIKKCVLTIQKNYIGKKKNSLNLEQCEILVKLINSCNIITEFVINLGSSPRESLNSTEDENLLTKKYTNNLTKTRIRTIICKTYVCEFCNKAYPNGQGLGGHISRIHPNQSYKYKNKIKIRNEREEKRRKLLEIKTKLFSSYGLDLQELISLNKKEQISNFLSKHRDEYLKIKKNEHRKDS